MSNCREKQGSNGAAAEDICLSCGLCCDGTIFADVKLQAGDDLRVLKEYGFDLLKSSRKVSEPGAGNGVPSGACRFDQPCPALRNGRCRIYEDRPRHCRNFDCVLLKSVKSGKTSKAAALGVIQAARECSDRVWQMLRELGDVDEELPLAKRFRRTTRRLEQVGLDKETAALYGELTLAVHDLNFLLSQAFYPGDK